jgi:hypothetical protein
MALKPRAKNFRDAMNNFDLDPLKLEELPDFYVHRQTSPIGRIKIMLESPTIRHLLFAGQRGSGKSSELARLEAELKDSYFVVRYSLVDFFDVYDLEYLDILVSIPIAIADLLRQNQLRLGSTTQKLIDNLWNFGLTSETIREKSKTEGGSVELGLGSSLAALLNLKAQLKSEGTTRDQVRSGVRNNISNLLEGIRLLVKEVQNLAQKPVLVIVEGTDRADLEKVRGLFYEHGQSLSSVPVSIIYTLPSAFITDLNFNQVRNFFDEMFVLPNFKIKSQRNGDNQEGLQRMRDLLLKRIDPGLITEDALNDLAKFCGGVPRNLVRLAHGASLYAREADASRIEQVHVRQAIVEERSFFRPSNQQIELLQSVKRSKKIDQTEDYWNLMHNLSILEYRNDAVWFDINPVLDELLNDQG